MTQTTDNCGRRKLKTPHRTNGIALVITLSILVLLTVTLSQTFQDTALEIKMIGHDENLFLARQTNRSLFRVFLLSLKTYGANKTKRFIDENLPKGFPIPITGDNEDGLFLNPEIESLDHYLNVNGTYSSNDDGLRNRDIIKNIVNYYAGDEPPSQFETLAFIGQIADLIDEDQEEINKNFLRGRESYVNENPYFLPKNKKIDLPSELKILPGFHTLNLKPNDINRIRFPITTIKSSGICLIKRFNVNFLPKKEDDIRRELIRYISMFEGIQDKSPCFYEEFYNSEKSEALVQTILRKFNSIDLGNTLFTIPLNKDPDWEAMIVSDFSFIDAIRTKLKEFFAARSSLIRITYSIMLGQVVIKSQAILRMNYGASDTDVPTKIEVLYFHSR